LDSYRAPAGWLDDIRRRAAVLVCVDDHDQIPAAADVVVQVRPEAGEGRNEADPGIIGSETGARQGPLVFRGARYTLLAEPFRQAKPRREVPPQATRFLLTLGGTDPHGLTPRLARRLLSILAPHDHLTVVVGPYFEQVEWGELAEENDGRTDALGPPGGECGWRVAL